jgi:hypothetical protein
MSIAVDGINLTDSIIIDLERRLSISEKIIGQLMQHTPSKALDQNMIQEFEQDTLNEF